MSHTSLSWPAQSACKMAQAICPIHPARKLPWSLIALMAGKSLTHSLNICICMYLTIPCE